jgi:hypothetical protein
LATIEFRPPFWEYSDLGLPSRTPYDQYRINYGAGGLAGFLNLPVTSVGRDMRGTYTGTINDDDVNPGWDYNDIVHTVTFTIS